MKKQMNLIMLAVIMVFTIFTPVNAATTENSNVKQKSVIEEKATKENSISSKVKLYAPKEPELKDSKIGYNTSRLRVREFPNTDSKILDVYDINTEIEYEIIENNDEWVKVIYEDKYAYMCLLYISDEKIEIEKPVQNNTNTNTNYYQNNSGGHLTRSGGVFYGPSGKETYYNLNMSGVVSIMRSMGNNDEYWVREDGCKMLGNYIMVAADLNVHPRGSLVPTSLGMGIVCDTGGFVSNGSGVALDIATTW